MLILRDAGLGLTRFDQFRGSLGIAPNILARRVKALTRAGLLDRRSCSKRPPRYEYLITEAGRDFLPVLQVIGARVAAITVEARRAVSSMWRPGGPSIPW